MRIAVMGTGGVGGYFGGRLAQHGEEVVFIARGEHLRVLKEQGLSIEDPEGKIERFPVRATDDPSEIGAVDAIIVSVKAWQVAQVAPLLKPLLGPETFVVPLQNGVEAPSILSENLGKEHVFGGLCYIVSVVAAPGRIRHAGINPYMAFGELDNTASERGQRLLSAFKKTGITAEIPADIASLMWQKFLFIAPMSGVGAATRAPIGVVRSVPETRALLHAAMHEVANLAVAKGISLKDNAIEATVGLFDSMGPQTTASMQRDIMDGRPSELHFQNGAVVRLAAEVGAPVPVNSFLFSTLLPLEMKARGEISF